MRFSVLLISFLILSGSLFSADLPSGFVEQEIASGLDPVGMTIMPDGRILITEKKGVVKVIKNGSLLETPFLSVNADNSNERGLQSIILDPDFEQNNFIYIYYSTPDGTNRLSRFTANGDQVVPGSEYILIEIQHNGGVHNGGAMVFGEDGKLHLAVGEAGKGTNSQDFSNVLGKILRINTDGSIPEDNPYYNTTEGNSRAIYALGVRNPFTMSVDTSGTILFNDVGGGDYEEVNKLEAGKNYGWPAIEGPIDSETPPDNYQDPLYAYSHDQGCAIVGAAFYQPSELASFPPEYWDKFFFADYCTGEMYYMDPETGNVLGTFATGINRLTYIKTSPNGDLYYLQRAGIGDGSVEDNTSTSDGTLIKISYTGDGKPFISKQPSDATVVPGETADFFVYASGEKPLDFQWMIDETPAGGDGNQLSLTDIPASLDGAKISCIITNPEGTITSDTAILTVLDNNRPEPVISLPSADETYMAGDTIFFEGYANDEEDGELSGENLTWAIDFHHDNHSHPALFPTNASEGYYIIPTTGETSPNVWYRVYLTATDEDGLSSTTYTEVQPVKSSLTVRSQPAGLPFMVSGREVKGDTTFTGVAGVTRVVQTEYVLYKNDSIYYFEKYSDDITSSEYSFSFPEQDSVITLTFEGNEYRPGKGLAQKYYHSEEDLFNDQNVVYADTGSVNFNWGEGAPQGVNSDGFYSKIYGLVRAPFSGEYTFYVKSDDGMNLWIDDTHIIEDWTSHSATEFSGSIYLEEGGYYPIVLEHFDSWNNAVLSLSWESEKIPKEIVPAVNLYPTDTFLNSVSSSSGDVSIYPVPFSDKLTIEGDDIEKLIIYNSNGARITDEIVNGNSKKINTGNLMPGLYILEVRHKGGKVRHKKIIKTD